MTLHRLAAFVFALMVMAPLAATAQTPASPAPASTQADQLLKPGELDALVAPIALYPDTLLSLVLMASTYPLEVVQAERWVTEHKNLDGDRLKKEVEKLGWEYPYGERHLVLREVSGLTARHMHRRMASRKDYERAGRNHHKA